MSETQEVIMRVASGENAQGKLLFGFVVVPPHALVTHDASFAANVEPFWYKASPAIKKLMGGQPGSMYTVTRTETGVKDIKFHSLWPVLDDRAEWTAKCRAVDQTNKARVSAAREQELNPMWERLEPIRRAYRESIGGAKSQLLADVVAYITRPSPGV